MRLKSYSKAQFFILTAFVIVSIVFFMARWIEPFTIIDTSEIVLKDEAFIFNNIKEKAFEVAERGTKSCEDLRYNMEEYRDFAIGYALERGYKLDFNYTSSPCYEEPPLFPVVIEIKLKLKSKDAELASNFSVSWTPS